MQRERVEEMYSKDSFISNNQRDRLLQTSYDSYHMSQIWLIIYESYKYKPEKGFNIIDKTEIDQVVLNLMEVKVVMRKI